MSLISKEHLKLTLQTLKALLSQKLGKEDHYTDEEVLELLSETVNLTPVTENGKLLVEGKDYLVV